MLVRARRESEEAHERRARLLAARLEALATASERSLSGERPLDGRITALEAATRHAVALGLLTGGEAAELWRAVAERHPGVAWCRARPPLAA
ncbi:MAG: hypothetical protein ICV74_05075 [Thermoleophilia bacterium]|nr:hypothetical protein [Thermoleophilia bacterium]